MTSCTGATGQTGTVYTYAQLQGLWINAGGPKTLAPLAAAIAMAESGGCSAAVNPTDNNGTQTSWGLWQISNGTHNQPVTGILSPAVNASQAVAKYQNAGGFSPWGTYTSGAYRQYYSGSTTPDTNVPSAGGAAPGANDPSTCLIGINGLGINQCFVDKSQARAIIGGACMAGGLLIMVVGLALVSVFALNRSGGVGRAIVNVTPAGRAVNRVTTQRQRYRRSNRATARRAATRRPATVQRRSAPGKDLTDAEIRQARANRRKLAAAKKPPPGRELKPKTKPKT